MAADNPFASISEGVNQGLQTGANSGADYAKLAMQTSLSEKELAFKKEQLEHTKMEQQFQKGKFIFDKIGDLAKLPAGPLKNEMLKGFGNQMQQLGYQDTSVLQAMIKDPESVKKLNTAMLKFPMLSKDQQAQVLGSLAETVGTDAFPKQLDNFLSFNLDLAKKEKEAAIELNKEKEKEKLKPSPAAEGALKTTGELVARQSAAVNQVFSRLNEFGDARMDRAQQVKVAQSMFKILNSMDGQDAVQREEADRIGGFLNKIVTDWKGMNEVQFNQNTEAFRQQVVHWLRGSANTVSMNNEQIGSIDPQGRKLNLKLPEISDDLGLYTQKELAQKKAASQQGAPAAPTAAEVKTIGLLQQAKAKGATKDGIKKKFPQIPQAIIDRVFNKE